MEVHVSAETSALNGVNYTIYSAGFHGHHAMYLKLDSCPDPRGDHLGGMIAELLARVNRRSTATVAFIDASCINRRPVVTQDVVVAFITRLASRYKVVAYCSYALDGYVVGRSTVERFPVGHRIAARELEYGGIIERSSDVAASRVCPASSSA